MRLLVMFLMLWPFGVSAIELDVPPVGLQSVPVEIEVTDATPGAGVTLEVAGTRYTGTADANGMASFPDVRVAQRGVTAIAAMAAGESAAAELRVLPGWISLLPAFLAIAVALLIRNVVPALVLGLWVGATTLREVSLPGAGKGLLDVFAFYISEALNDTDRVAIILFTMMIGGMVGIITRNGGMARIVQVVVSKARTAIGGQVSVWLMGLR